MTPEELMNLVDAYADATFTQGLEQDGGSPIPEQKREAVVKAIQAMSAQLAQPESEPVAWRFIDDEDGGHISYSGNEPTQAQKDYLAKWNRPAWTPLYATPQPDYVPLTDDLVLLVWRLAASLRRAKPGSEIAQQAIDFINSKGLTPSPLRQVGEQAVRGKT